MNYGEHPDDWRPSGGDWEPPDWDVEAAERAYAQWQGAEYRPRRVNRPEVTWPPVDTFCVSCKRIRPGENGLSLIERNAKGERYFEAVRFCRACRDELAQL